MNTTATTIESEAVRKINRHMLKFIAVRVITPIAVAAACALVSKAIENKMDAAEASEEHTD